MSRVIYYVGCSVDGFIATPDGDISWLEGFNAAGEDYGFAAFYETVGELIMGARTYEQTLTFDEWPHPGKRTHVLSRRSLAAAQPEVTVTAAELPRLVQEIGARTAKDIWLVGGGVTAGAFLSAGLIDELVITYVPVVLGQGIPLIQGVERPIAMRRSECQKIPDGVVQLTYVIERGGGTAR